MSAEHERQNVEKDVPANYYAPDGYRYGVMFSDGSVAERWSGRTQREQAQHKANQSAAIFPHSNITLARRLPGEPWTRVLPPGQPADNYASRTMHADVKLTGLDVEPTGVVEVSIEALRVLASAAGWDLIERPVPPASTGDER
jgi:hypothetical protein